MVVVKFLDGSEETFLSSSIDTVGALKEAVRERVGIALESQVLVYEKRTLQPDIILASVGISEGSVITLLTTEGETLREVFKRFDLNGDGTIDRAELGSVLKGIDEATWTDSRADELFNSFDASKDALIQVDEFCEWLGLADVRGPTSLDVVTKTMGEVMIALVAVNVRFCRGSIHCIELRPDGTYMQRARNFSSRSDITKTGTYTLIRSLRPMTNHKLVLQPLLEPGDSRGGSLGGNLLKPFFKLSPVFSLFNVF